MRTELLAALLATTASLPLLAQQGSATYQLVFQTTWSQSTHPAQFPPNPHFSPMVGATHGAAVSFWQPNGVASPGIENMAETGGTSPLTNEVQAAVNAGTAGQVLVFGGLGTSPGSLTVQFTATAEQSLLTLVSMLAPSPDWFVGVHGLPLMANGDWIDDLVIPLQVYDAGTDSGATYLSPDLNTVPQAPIAPITTSSGPFQGLLGPIGTFTLHRLHGTAVYGCNNPSGSLVVAGTARVGQSLTLSITDPTAMMTAPSLVALVLSTGPSASFPCGTALFGLGLGPVGTPGEILIASFDIVTIGPVWTGSPVPIVVSIPAQPSFAMQRFYLQGLLASDRIGLTRAVSMLVGN